MTCVVASICWSVLVFGEQSSRAQTLMVALSQLKRTPEDKAAQQQYLAAFPADNKKFLSLFEPNRELYDGYEYIQALSGLGNSDPQAMGQLLVSLSKDAHYDADVPAYLQRATATFAAKHTKFFLN